MPLNLLADQVQHSSQRPFPSPLRAAVLVIVVAHRRGAGDGRVGGQLLASPASH